METINPKALQLSILKEAKNKVTLGFKCDAILKLNLALEAKELGITLSEYVESIVSSFDLSLNKTLQKQKVKIAFYENDILKEMYNKHRNESVDFITATGVKKNIRIESVEDIFTIISESFKTK